MRRLLAAARLAVAALASGFVAVASWLLLGTALERGTFFPFRDLVVLAGTLGTLFIAPFALLLGLALRLLLTHWRKEQHALVVGLAAGAISGLLIAFWVESGVGDGPAPPGQLFSYGLFLSAGALAGLTFHLLMPPIPSRSR